MGRSAAIRCALGVALLSCAFSAAPASAQGASAQLNNGGMDLRLFRPAVDSKGFLTVNGTDVLPHNQFSFGLLLNGGFHLLPFNGYVEDSSIAPSEADRVDHLVDNYFTGVLQFNYGLFNRLVLGIQLPIHAVSGPRVVVPALSGAPSAEPIYNQNGDQAHALDHQGIGDIVLHAKVRILRAETDPIGLAAIAYFEFPSGKAHKFAGEPGVGIWPVLALEYVPIHRIRLGLNVGYRFNTGDGASFPVDATTDPQNPMLATMAGYTSNPSGSDVLTYDDLLTFGFGVSFRVADSLDLVGELYGSQIVTGFGDKGALSMEALGGLKIFVQRNSYLVVAGGGGLPPRNGFQRADWRAMLGFMFEPSIGDADGDGIKDDQDKCPNDPEDFDHFEDEDGCPDLDNDKDNIPDVDDACPDTPENYNGLEDEDGCPDGDAVNDRDGDGIADADDKCPDVPEDIDGHQDDDGCPEDDADHDGILDADDLCPEQAEDKDGHQDEDGCPDPDNDKDRILDTDDECPTDPETYNGFEDEDGCPDRGSVVIEDNQLVILEKIYFKTDSAEILQKSYPIIDAVAATLNGNPQIKLLEVQGHADERGADEYNLRLTRDRAAAVVDALVQRGVSRKRLRSAGYGELCPVDKHHNRAAWEKNRRVEFKIVETEDGPTGVEVACPAARHLVPGNQ